MRRSNFRPPVKQATEDCECPFCGQNDWHRHLIVNSGSYDILYPLVPYVCLKQNSKEIDAMLKSGTIYLDECICGAVVSV